MKQKSYIIPVIITIVVIVVGAVIYFSRQNDGDNSGVYENNEVKSEKENNIFTGSVTDLLQKGQNLTCTYNQAGAITTAGTVYVASQGQQVRGDFTFNQPDGTEINSHFIQDGNYGYFWSDQLPQGIKISISEEDREAPQQDTGQTVFDDSFDYNCQPWIVNNNLFNLPSDKEFFDTEQMQQNQCSTCDQLQEPSKSQCLQALDC